MIRFARLASLVATLAVAFAGKVSSAGAQPVRLEYRVVQAAPRELQRRIDEAGREGFACVSVARPETDVKLNSVVVVLARPSSTTVARATHRVERAAGSGSDLQSLLDRSGSEGFHLCGVALAEISPFPVLVAVMSRPVDGDTGAWHYAAEVLGQKDRLARLVAKAHEGFVPVAASPVSDNRVVEMRNWILVTERSATSTEPIDLAIRSGPGPDSVQRAIVEQSKLGYIANLFWKEGNTTIVVAMSRSPVNPTVRPEFVVETIDPSRLDGWPGVYIGDVPYLSDGQRVVLTIKDSSTSTSVVEDRLPVMGTVDSADINAMRPLGEHLSRNRYRLARSSIRRGKDGSLVLHTVLTRLSP